MRKKTLIISAFPGCGKTHLFLNQAAYGYSIADSDSSKFPKIKDWEKTYVDHIEKYIGCYLYVEQRIHKRKHERADVEGHG